MGWLRHISATLRNRLSILSGNGPGATARKVNVEEGGGDLMAQFVIVAASKQDLPRPPLGDGRTVEVSSGSVRDLPCGGKYAGGRESGHYVMCCKGCKGHWGRQKYPNNGGF